MIVSTCFQKSNTNASQELFKHLSIEATRSVATSLLHPTHSSSEWKERAITPLSQSVTSQELQPGLFVLYYILTKMGLTAEADSLSETKQEIETTHAHMETLHKQRLDELKQILSNEGKTKRWSVSVKMFSWVASLTSIVAGLILMISGVGAVTGALLIAAGTLTATNHALEVTGGWNKIASLLPDEDPTRVRVSIVWMQMGLTFLSIILGGSAGLFGGFSKISAASGQFSAVIGGVFATGQGISTIGEGVLSSDTRDKLAHSKYALARLENLKQAREALLEYVSAGLKNSKALFEDLNKALEYDEELRKSTPLIG